MQTVPNSMPANIQIEDDRTGLETETLKRAFLDNLFYIQGKFPALATPNDYYMALAYTVRDRLLRRWLSSAELYTNSGSRTVCYLSAEFLMGPHLGNNLINLGIYNQVNQAIEELGLNLDELLQQEEEPGLGNGGLGRLAACYLDSLASLEIPAIGYGIRYEFGIFDQEIHNGWQVEITDKWLRYGNPWEIARPDWAVDVKFGGHTESFEDELEGRFRVRWVPHKVVRGIPTTRRFWAIRSTPPTRCGCGRQKRQSRLILRRLTQGITWVPCSKRAILRTFPRCSTPMTSYTEASSCG